VTGNVGAVFLFEWKRAMTLPRMAWWAVLASFPVFIIGMIRFLSQQTLPRELWAGFLFALLPMLISMLGTFLWTTPAISAVTWVIPPALLGLSIAVPLAASGDGWRLWWTMARLICLSCPAYGAIYLLLGTLMPRRAMVLAVAYTLIFEFIISFVPAVINRITVQYRLRSLLEAWCDLSLRGRQAAGLALAPDTPVWQHVLILALFPPVLLALSVAVLRWSEFSSSAESDV
jgi:hypothetical protein